MIRLIHGFRIRETDIEIVHTLASGPGGQNVNKVATAVLLYFDLQGCDTLPQKVRERAKRLAGRRLTGSGKIVIDARRFRSQAANRRDAIERLVALLNRAIPAPTPRKPTRPSAGAMARRRKARARHADIKKNRRKPPID